MKTTRTAKRILWFLPLLSMILLTGCWDRREINDVGFVLATAIDLEKNNQYRVSLQVALPGQMGGESGGGGGTGGDKSYYIDSATGKTVGDAMNSLQKRMSRFLTTSHVRVYVIGEDLAKKGVKELFSSLGRGTEYRLNAYMMVAKGKAYDLLGAQPKFERFPAEALRELAKTSNMTVKDLANSMALEGSDAVMPYMGVEESQKGDKPSKEIALMGYALFDNGHMSGLLQGENLSGFNFMLHKKMGFMTLELAKQDSLDVFLTGGTVRILPKLSGNNVSFDIRITAAASIVETMSMRDLTLPVNTHAFEKKLSEKLQASITGTLHNLQKSDSDAIGFGEVISRELPGKWKNISGQWKKDYFQQAAFHVQVDSNITRAGLISENIAKKEPKS
ncbi:Ger(x)C family spore germination protein [Paenibacillus gansuensis]|uniref:Ger(X)C family spore germination protein n=1 Tax=Paenibacillus gansuensis TaxID=306542 RepID=A0ABW5PEL6_9BACL